MPQRKELSQFANRPGITGAFVKQQTGITQQAVYNPDATVDWIVNNSGLGYLPLDIDIPWRTIYKEAQSVLPFMIADHAGDTDSHGWLNFGIYARGAHDLGDYGRVDMTEASDWTDLAKKYMPETVRYFQDSWPHKQIYRLRLLGLEPNGVIGLHTDDCTGLNNINMAIDHPDECDFVLENSGVIPFKNGQAFLVNTGLRHAVVNRSNRLRLHIVVYQENDTHFGNLVLRSYNKYFEAS
jgi:hypothetical protein